MSRNQAISMLRNARYDAQLAPQLNRLAELRAEEERLWLDVKANEQTMQLALDRWENVCTAVREELDRMANENS